MIMSAIFLMGFQERFFGIGDIKALLALSFSHEHSDHCSGVKNLKTRSDFDIYTREMTGYAAGIGDFYRINGETVIGNFRVRAINISIPAI